MKDEEISVIMDTLYGFRSVMGEIAGEYTANEIMALLTMEKSARQGVKTTMGDLAAALKVSKPAVSQTVDRLVKKGCVERYTGPTDRRVVCARVSDKFKASWADTDKRARRFLELLGREDLAELKRIMGKSADVMRKLRQEGYESGVSREKE